MINTPPVIDDAKGDETVRDLRWPEGVKGRQWGSAQIPNRGHEERQQARQRYEGQGCGRQLDDLSETVFEGQPQPLRVWVVCLSCMGLNLSKPQSAAELALDKDDVQTMPTQLRAGIALNNSQSS